MSTAAKKRSRRDHELDRLRRRLNSPRPDLPILRTSERPHPTPSAPLPPPEVGQRPDEGEPSQPSSATPPPPLLRTQHSELSTPNDWSHLLPLPPGLPATFRRWLFRHIDTVYRPNPNDSTAQYLAARIALAMAHQHLAAAREPDKLCTTWLRYEAMADRQFRNALRDWTAHQKAAATQPATRNAAPTTPPMEARSAAAGSPLPPPSTPAPPQTPPNPPDATFAHTNHLNPPVSPPAAIVIDSANPSAAHAPANAPASHSPGRG